jgi:cytochrome c
LITAAAFAEVHENRGSESMKSWAGLAVVCAAIAASAAPAPAQDAANGAAAFRRCRACHAVGPGAHNKTGPQLNKIVGRKAASVSGFDYSDALKAKAANGLVWTEANLTAYLQAPDAFVPGGVMAFAGVKDPKQLQDLIAYLKTQ